MLLIADNKISDTKNYRQRRRCQRRPRRRYNHRSCYWRKDCGRLLKTPISFVHSMGRRMLEWLELRQERFMHTRSSPEDMDRTLYELSKVSAERCYYLPPSTPPPIRLPHHLRRPPFKIYVPRRRLPTPSFSCSGPRKRASFRRAHYQSLRGRPVPVPIDVIRFLTQRGVVSMSSLPKIIQDKLRDLSKIPDYLTFSSYANTSLVSRSEALSPVGCELASKNSKPLSKSSKYFATFVPACSDESDGDNTRNDWNSSDSAVEGSPTADVTDDDEKSAFSVTSSNVSPKLLEVVASLRAKSGSPQLCRDLTKPNNLDRQSVKNNCRSKLIITSTDTRRSLRYLQTQFSEGVPSSYSSRRDLMRRSCHNLSERPQCRKLSIFSESDSLNYNYCLPANVTDFKFDDHDNFWRNYSKKYTKSVVALTNSSSTNDENTYDAVDPIYDAISDSGYSSIALSSQESVETPVIGYEQQLSSCGSSPLINTAEDTIETTIRRSNNSKGALARLSQSFGRFTISNKGRGRSKSFEIYVDLFKDEEEQKSERQKSDDSKWRTKSAEELSLYSSVDVAELNISCTPVDLAIDLKKPAPNSASFSNFCHVTAEDSGKLMVTPKPQRSFLHSPASLQAGKFNQQLCVKRELPPIPAFALSVAGSEVRNTPGEVSALHGVPTKSMTQVSTAPPCSVKKIWELSGGSDGRPNTGAPTGSVGRLSSNQPQHFKQAPKRSFHPVDPTTKLQQAPFNVPPRLPSAIAPSPSVPGGAFKHSSAAALAPGGVVTGGSGGGGLPARRLPVTHFNSQTISADATGGAVGKDFQAQLNAQSTGKKVPPHPSPFHGSSLNKGLSSAGGQIPLKPANYGGVLHEGDVTPAPLQHVAGGVQKALPLLPPLPLHAPTDSSGHTVRAIPTLPGGITGVRRPGLENKGAVPSMAVTKHSSGPQMSSGVPRPGNEYTTLEGENECHHQESVRLSNDGPRIVLTPLYKSLVQQDFFHLVTRDNAETLLKGCSPGSFLVRPSTRGHPLTLMLTHQGSFCNIGIRHRADGLFALGAEKLNEKTFKSVEELIEFYRKNLLKLNTGGEVLLTNSPAHDAMHIYVRVPIKNGFSGNSEMNGS